MECRSRCGENSDGAIKGSSAAVELIEQTVCPICGSDSAEILRDANYPSGLTREQLLGVYRSSSDQLLMDRLVRCSGCSLVYLNPRVRAEIAMESYSSAVDPTFAAQNAYRIKTFSRTLGKLSRLLSIKDPGAIHILDVGSAGGAFVKAAVDFGFQATGVEPSAWLCEQGRKTHGINLITGTLEGCAFANASFSMVTLWDVLEHLYDPCSVLKECHRVLKEDGCLVVNYPDYGSIACRTLGSKWPFFLNVHLYYFTRSTICQILKKCGFEVLRISPFWQTLELSYVLKRATPYFGMFNILHKLTENSPVGRLPFTYNVGQTMVVAKRR